MTNGPIKSFFHDFSISKLAGVSYLLFKPGCEGRRSFYAIVGIIHHFSLAECLRSSQSFAFIEEGKKRRRSSFSTLMMPLSTFRPLRACLFALLFLTLLFLIGVCFALVQCSVPALHRYFPVREFVCRYSLLDGIPLIVAFGYWLAGALSWRERLQATSTLFFCLGSVAFRPACFRQARSG